MTDVRGLITRFSDEAHGRGRTELIGGLCHEDFVDHTLPEGLPPGREGEKAYVRMVHDAVSDMTSTTERLVVDGNKAAWRWRAEGTHTGEFMGVPASANEIEVTGINLAVVRDGRIAELWAEFDMLDVMTQLGAIDPPAG